MAFFFSLLLSCNKNPIAPNTIRTILIPLAVGNEWDMVRTGFDSIGTVTSTEAESILIKADTTIAGQHWFYRDYGIYYFAYQNTETGVLTRLISPYADTNALIYFKYPTQVGDTYGHPWVIESPDHASMTDTAEQTTVLSTDEVITVPAGTFHCIKYHTILLPFGSNFYFDEYVSPNYGWIRTDEYIPTQDGTVYLFGSTQTTKITLKSG